MPAPSNFILPQTDPLAGFTRAFKFGSDIRQVGLEQEAEGQRITQQDQINASILKLQTPEASSQDFSNAMLLVGPERAKSIKSAFELQSSERSKAALARAGKTVFALRSGNAQMGVNLLTKQAEAQRNSGNEEQAQFLETWANVAKESPEQAANFFAGTMTLMEGGKEALDSVLKIAQENRDIGSHKAAIKQAGLDAKLTGSQITENISNSNKIFAEVQKTNILAGKAATDAQLALIKLQQARNPKVVLDAPAKKLINDSVVSAVNSKSLANQYETLANSITTEIASGKIAEAEEAIKRVWGSEDEVSRLRQEYKRLRNSQVLQSLPPGVASDKDIEIAMGVFPAETANPQTIASFLNGFAKLQRYEASVNELKADWVNSVGSLSRTKKSGDIGGHIYAKGDSFSDAVSRIETVSPIDDQVVVDAPPVQKRVSVDF